MICRAAFPLAGSATALAAPVAVVAARRAKGKRKATASDEVLEAPTVPNIVIMWEQRTHESWPRHSPRNRAASPLDVRVFCIIMIHTIIL